MKDIISICVSTVNSSSRLYMRCNTYIKLGAKEIAHNENAVLKRAVKFNEFKDLDSDMDHCDPKMLEMYKKLVYIHRALQTPTLPPIQIDNEDRRPNLSWIVTTTSIDTNSTVTPNLSWVATHTQS